MERVKIDTQHRWNKSANNVVAECIELYVSGYSILEVSNITGVYYGTVSKWIARYWIYNKFDNPVVYVVQSKV